MNKKEIENLIPKAYAALDANTSICKEGKISKSFRGQIATLGTAIAMGSLLSAVAFFSKQGEAKVSRDELLNVIWVIMRDEYKLEGESLKEYVLKEKNTSRAKEYVVNCAVAVKLAMNLFELIEELPV